MIFLPAAMYVAIAVVVATIAIKNRRIIRRCLWVPRRTGWRSEHQFWAEIARRRRQ